MEHSKVTKETIESVQKKLTEILSAPHETKAQIKTVLGNLSETVQEFDKVWHSISRDSNKLAVQRAVTIGTVCCHVKDSLLHGKWTTWAAENVPEDIRTIQKFMSLARSRITHGYAYLGTEKVYQLIRLEHLLIEGTILTDLFSASDLDTNFERNYSCKQLEKAATQILNQNELQQLDIDISNEAIKSLTGNFSLIRTNHEVISRLADAKDEEANLEKVVKNIVATGGSRRSIKRKNKAAKRKEDMNAVMEKFVESFNEMMQDPDKLKNVKEERLRFIVKLIDEFLKDTELSSH